MAKAEVGDGWELRCGDCLDPETGLASIEAVDHVITDPPYAKVVVTTAKGASPGTVGRQQTRDLAYQGIDNRAPYGGEIARLARRWILVFCDAESLSEWRTAVEVNGARHIRMGAWVSPACTPQFTGDRPGTGWEACEIAHGQGRSRWNGGGRPAVWIVNRPLNNSDERRAAGHPTPKPVALLCTIVRDFTDPGELICDPFAGSATTGVAAIRLGRRFIGWERDPDFFKVAVKRLRATHEQGQLFGHPISKPKQPKLPGLS